MENICSFCLQPGTVFPTGENSALACVKCQPYVQDPSLGADMNIDYNSVIEPQIMVHHGHQISLDGDDSLHCHLCSKTFEKSLQYQNHMRNHKAERKYACPHCSKAFSQSNNLRAHLRIHTNERPYKCNECGKAFTQVTNLNNHIRLHTGERPFACTEPGCDRAFAQVTNLNNHRKSHMRDGRSSQQQMPINRRNIIPTCTDCGLSFNTQMALNRHAREHCRPSQIRKPNKEIVNKMEGFIKCPFGDCMRSFESTVSLHQHLSKDHGLTINSNKSKPKPRIPVMDDEIIEIEDDDSPPKTERTLQPKKEVFDDEESAERNGSNTTGHHEKWKQHESSSESDDDASGDEDEFSDSCESGRRKEETASSLSQNVKLVCNVCFSTFDNEAALEKHVRSKHK